MPSPPDIVQPARIAATTLQIHLLGPPMVMWANRSLDILRRQVRALLYYLAAGRQLVPREQLCCLFWPEAPEATARRNLTALLTHLHRALPIPQPLTTAGDLVGLDPAYTWTDIRIFEHLCTSRKPLVQAGILQQAVDLYRGPFLAGFSLPGCPEFEAWVVGQRQAWERLFLEALASLIQELEVAGKQAAAITYTRRYLETDDLAEDMHRRLIELYSASGDRSAAMSQFEQCVTILERELGVSPLPETQAAYRAALDGSPSPGAIPPIKPAWRTLPGLDLPMIGRDEAMGRLEEVCIRARSGHGQVVLISGEAGIGKSRLMQEFATRLQDWALILAGCGYPDTQTMPYQPIIEALRPILSTQQGMASAQPAWLAEASRLMPDLHDIYPNLPPPGATEPNHARIRLFEALCCLTMSLATGSLLVLLCLDDLHWADDTTLDWLAYLGRQVRGSRLLVLGTFQSEEAGTVARLRHGLTRQGILTELRLERLDETEILQLLQHLGDSLSGKEALASRLYQTTGGNPFFLLETLRALIESDLEATGRRDVDRLRDLPLPATIRAAVEARVERLSSQARQVLGACAVLGRTFSFDLVHLTAGRRELETLDALDELAARHLLKQENGEYGFCHQVTRTAVYRSLSHWRRRLLHRRAAEALERLHLHDDAALARHFECAEDLGQAAHHALRAGQAAKAVFGHAEARAHFDRALLLLEQEAVTLRDPEAIATNRRLRIQALYERGWVLRLLGDMETYAYDIKEVARLADSLGDPRTLAHLRWREAYTHRWFCRYAKARQTAEDGVRLSIAAADRYLEAMCQREVGLVAREVGDHDKARVLLEQALALFAETNNPLYEIHTMGNLSTLFWRVGEYERAMALARQALARCDEAGLSFDRRIPLADMGVAAAAMGDTDSARRWLLESLTIAHQIADRTQEIFCLLHLGELCIRLQQPAEAVEHLQAGLTLAERVGSCAEQSQLLSGLAKAHHLAGDRERAQAFARQALDKARMTGRPFDEELARRILDRLESG